MIAPPSDIGIYVHWPFCKAKCPYCDFNSHVRRETDDMAFAYALTRELSSFASLTPRRRVASVFFGGGTPSLMPPAAVDHILECIARLWDVSPEAEITLEANPTSAEAENFRGYRSAGVNRLSVGVQALNDGDLQELGRRHTAAEAIAAFQKAARIFPRVSFDLIYARPRQSPHQWREELLEALKIQEGHMSLYQLTIEEGTRFHELYRLGLLAIPSESLAAVLFEITQELTSAAGLDAYEVSNHARTGHESRHNLIYWRYEDYIGIGPGAHSRLASGTSQRLAISTERDPETWRNLVGRNGHGRTEQAALAPVQQGMEMLLMGLRLREGISTSRYEKLTGRKLDQQTISLLADQQLITQDENSDRLMATPKGRRLLNSVTSALAMSG
jgi:oxygen-independent coproporphyrinogen-3 oxidase